jgi:hypothetical protein
MSMKKRIDVLYFIPACLFCPWLWIQIVPAPVPTLISWMGDRTRYVCRYGCLVKSKNLEQL